MIKQQLFFAKKKLLLLSMALGLLLILSGSLFFMTHSAVGKRANGQPTSPVPTATPGPSFPSTVTPISQALFLEDFSDDAKGWYLSDRSGYTRTFANNALILQDTNQKVLIESLPNARVYDNFIATVYFRLYGGDGNDSVGLYLRGDSNLDHDYRLDIYGDMTYDFSKESLGGDNLPENTPLIGPDPAPTLKGPGQENKLTVTLNGPTIALAINDQPVTSFTDTDYTKGQVALFVNNGITSGGVTAAFDYIEIDGLPPSSPQS